MTGEVNVLSAVSNVAISVVPTGCALTVTDGVPDRGGSTVKLPVGATTRGASRIAEGALNPMPIKRVRPAPLGPVGPTGPTGPGGPGQQYAGEGLQGYMHELRMLCV